ncbi:MAG: D-2-hydroxyacid dehydrogenase [Pirellulales bacterium]
MTSLLIPKKIVLCYPVEARHMSLIQSFVPGSTVIDAGQERISTEILDADIYCGHAKVPVPWEDVVQKGRLQWIQSSAAGLDHCLSPAVVQSRITVTSASGVLADQVAEHAVGLAIACTRRLPIFFKQQQHHEFVRRPTRDLTGSSVGIVGFGGVGRRLAEVLKPFNTRILATDWFPSNKPDHVEFLGPPSSLSKLLTAADIIFLCVPLTKETTGMINASTLAQMKKGSILVNMARGKLVIEEALVEALESNHLDSVALDVTPEEPLPRQSRLWNTPNLLITPHVAGQSGKRIDAMTQFFCDNIVRFLGNKTLKNLVDKQLGFPRQDEQHI